MKPFKMHSIYLAPLLVLAVMACAKRDSEFAKKTANNRAAGEEKQTDRSGKTTPKDSVNTGTVPGDADNTTKEQPTKSTYAGDLENSYKESCNNMISMEIDADQGEEEITLNDLITKEKQTYTLQSTELFAEKTEKGTKVSQQVVFSGSLFEIPKDFKSQAQDQKTVITCHNVKMDSASKQELNADLILPYDISAESGDIKILRQDKVELKTSKSTAASTLYTQAMNLKDALSKDADNKKILIVKHKDSSNITIKIQSTTTDEKTGATLKKTISGAYALKK